jgi:hypothetical protein
VLFIRLVIIYSRFQRISLQKHLGLVLRPKRDLKETGLELVTSSLTWVSLVRPERDPNETYKRPKGDLFATSACVVVYIICNMICRRVAGLTSSYMVCVDMVN